MSGGISHLKMNSIPIPYTVDASVLYDAIADLPWAVWLDSAGLGRYDILCAQPVATLVSRGGVTEIKEAGEAHQENNDPFDLLQQQLGANAAAMPGIPFAGGAMGYWGYDLARQQITLPTKALDAEKLPDMAVGIYDWAIVLDHYQKTAQLVSHQRYPETEQVLPEIIERLHNPCATSRAEFKVHGRIESNFTRAEYGVAYAAVQHHLRAGDCYQVNLAQRYAARATGDAYQAYRQLRTLSPAPYSAFLDFPHAQILCASPECFLNVRADMVTTRPIKGTRPRMADRQRDVQTAHELEHSSKDRAENLMIVDLLRNDLGKSCVPGSVRVPKLFELESYAQVHHLVSTVTGVLSDGADAVDLLKNCFPGGSVTGAPKQRAMQIIEQLEPHRRGVYCGTVGYIGFDGNMDTNIAIRTLIYSNNQIRFWTGGGIVADSIEADEYQETQDKAVAMLKILQQFGGA